MVFVVEVTTLRKSGEDSQTGEKKDAGGWERDQFGDGPWRCGGLMSFCVRPREDVSGEKSVS